MAKEEGIRAKRVREYLAMFPKDSKRSIAKKLFTDFPILFNDVEDARNVIRRKTNSASKADRKTNRNPVVHKTNFSAQNPYGLPPNK